MRHQKVRMTSVGVFSMLAIVLSLVGCSSSGEPASGQSSGSAGRATNPGSGTQTAGAPITIGLVCDCSGAFGAGIKAGAQASQAWAKSVNAAGGIEGHQVKLIVKDTKSDVGNSVEAVKALISSDVDVIIGASNLDSAWADTVAAAKIPVVSPGMPTEPPYTNPDFYPSGQTNDSIFYANIAMAKQAGAGNIGIVYCAEAAGCKGSVAPMTKIGKQLGVPVIYSSSIAANAPNFTAQCVAAQQKHVSALFVAAAPETSTRVATDCDRQGYDPTYILEGAGFTMSLASVPGFKRDLWVSYGTLPYWSDAAPVQEMKDAMDKYYPGVRENKEVWNEFGATSWTAGILIEEAFKLSGVGASGTPTAATMTRGLNKIKNNTLRGWTSPLTFAAGQPHKVDCWYVGRVSNGTPKLANNGRPSCVPSSKGGSSS